MTNLENHPPGTRPYAEGVLAYAQAGWPCVIPVPPETKSPPPSGFTGAEGRDTDHLQLVRWYGELGHYSIALRMPEGVIGIDVDHYDKTVRQADGTDKVIAKRGAETIADLERQWGPLPATWSSTARGDAAGPGLSRIMLFRVPAQRYVTKFTDVEIIQRHHRYAVVWPSPHGSAGIYTWYAPDGTATDAPPKPEELAELPAAWVLGLTEGASAAGPASADHASGATLLDQLLEDWRPECADITSARLTATDELNRADAGSRHDTMTARIHHLVQLSAQGHTGVAWALGELRAAWANLTAGENRAEEFERMLLTSARKAVSVVGLTQVPRDPCLFAHVMSVPGPAPGDESGDGTSEAVEPARWWSVREVIGTHAFDPNAGLDQPLAQAVLERTWPLLRYAYDSRGWLLRVPGRWELHDNLSGWAVAQVGPLMPVGDSTAEKDSEQYARHQRRSRLLGNAGARAVAKKVDDLVSGGMHPSSVRLGDLDSDPEILWAGGFPWSLRASTERPLVADPSHIDPATPHMHSAGVTPDPRPTPLWDTFLEAVWPDPELRAWALRVLSITLTGYADRALPILMGETGRGKTQVITLLMSVLGSYAHAADPRLMTPGGENAHASIVFALKGRRFSFIDEGPREGRVAQERLKQLTGGGELTANQMNQNPITFRPSHTLVLTTNDDPPLTDPAIRSRARLIPCAGDPEAVRVARAAIGHVSGHAWRAEAPGVLAAMMVEAARWLAEPTTASVAEAPAEIRYLAEHLGAEQDPIRVWVEEETEPSETGTASRELYQAFTSSCMRNNLRRDAIPSETKWGRALTQLGYGSMHTEHGKRRPLRLKSGGFLPGMTPPAPVQAQQPPAAPADGLTPDSDGFMTGSGLNPSGTFPQVNPRPNANPDGSDGLEEFPTHTHARTRAHEARPENASNPSGSTTGAHPETAPDLRKQGPDGFEQPARKRREPSETSKTKAAATREAKRQAAIQEAGGPRIDLPALVTGETERTVALTDADALLGTITTTDAALTVDVEHTGYPVGHQDFVLRTVQLGNHAFAVVLDPSDPAQAEVIGRHLAAASTLHAHSATADLVPLADAGLVETEEAWAKMLDTGLLAKLADPSSTGNDADLKSLSKNVLGEAAMSPAADEARKALFRAGRWLTDTEVTTPVERSGWAQVDARSRTMVRYAASDVLDDAALALRLPRPIDQVLHRELTVQRMTARVSHRGIRLDGDQIARLLEEHRTARTTHAETVRAFGIDNPGSNPQVGETLAALGAPLPRTGTGKPSVAKGVLEPMKDAEGPVGDLVRAVLDYRHHNTALVLLLEPYWELFTRGDGRARPTIYTLGADTGRMSSSRPNVQQVSREGGMRACFTADPGYRLISADFASVEIRVAAALSQDAALSQMLLDGIDMHGEIARIVWGPGFTKSDRYKAKRKVFGRIYGQGLEGMANTDGAGIQVARAVIDAMDALTPGLTEWSRRVSEAVKAGSTQFATYAGRIVHMPKTAPHAAPNYCIQGTARELLIDALMRWRETPWGEATLFPVHDEVVAMVPEADAEAATAALVECMTTELAGVSIVAEASAPTFAWADSV